MHPVLIVSEDMQILFANPAAETMLADQATIRSQRGQLHFSYPQAHGAVARAVELGMRDEFGLGPGRINVPLARVSVPAVAHVLPLGRRDAAARMAHRAAAAIFIAAAGVAPLPALDAIAALFGLTAAEKRVAGHVAAGFNRTDIAAAAGVSDGTVKTQLAASSRQDRRARSARARAADPRSLAGCRSKPPIPPARALNGSVPRCRRCATAGSRIPLASDRLARDSPPITARPRRPSRSAWQTCRRPAPRLHDSVLQPRPGRTASGPPAPC